MEEVQQIHEVSKDICERKDSASSANSNSYETESEVTSFREKLKSIIHSHKFQIIIICFVFLDCLLVIAALLFDLEILHASEHSEVPHILHYASIGILSLFIIELIVKLYAVRLEFFHHKIEIFDAVIIIVSFTLDVIFRDHTGIESGTGLLIVLRLWRVIRIINGIVVSVKKEADVKVHKERKQRETCEEKLTKYRGYYIDHRHEIKTLRSLLHQHGITDKVSRWSGKIDVMDDVKQLPETTGEQRDTNEKIKEYPSAAVV
ncbi:hypothetical protein ACJMK2_011878 [Sinanodonta woodiana]|uniref:Voltage-gated hydrogen channel 1 n=1 Tax=Sinanodonta woodiana TaxID=1069815 RepID=A0ABD3V6D3_SINWO